jgi:hypothetical protein
LPAVSSTKEKSGEVGVVEDVQRVGTDSYAVYKESS